MSFQSSRRTGALLILVGALLAGCSSFGEQDRQMLMDARAAADRAAAAARQAQDAAAASAKAAADANAAAQAATERADRMYARSLRK
jgi:hypothetical protein